MTPSPPLRFLMLVVAGWVCLRGALLGSAWWADRHPVPLVPPPAIAAASPPAEAVKAPGIPFIGISADRRPASSMLRAGAVGSPPPLISLPVAILPPEPLRAAVAEATPVAERLPEATPAAPAALARTASRWSASAWAFKRPQGPVSLAPGGTLGGSQAGARIGFRLNDDMARPLALSLRGYAPLDEGRGEEVAAGLDWKPIARLPLHLLAERRQAVGENGRSAFAVTLYGGVSDIPAGSFRIDGYGQAGIVGLRSRDKFADGSFKASLAIGQLKIGAGAWAAAQPDVSRVDIGPQMSVRLVPGINAAADWRRRVAGSAAPASGPSFTLSADF